MMDQPTHERESFAWLTPEAQTRLAAFKAYAVNHARLDEVDMQLTQAILEPAGFAHVVVYGPSGVGKTTMIRRVTNRVRALSTPMAEPQPLSAQGDTSPTAPGPGSPSSRWPDVQSRRLLSCRASPVRGTVLHPTECR